MGLKRVSHLESSRGFEPGSVGFHELSANHQNKKGQHPVLSGDRGAPSVGEEASQVAEHRGTKDGQPGRLFLASQEGL